MLICSLFLLDYQRNNLFCAGNSLYKKPFNFMSLLGCLLTAEENLVVHIEWNVFIYCGNPLGKKKKKMVNK